MSKMQTVQFGKQLTERNYMMNDIQLEVVTEGKDLGILIRRDMEVSSQ